MTYNLKNKKDTLHTQENKLVKGQNFSEILAGHAFPKEFLVEEKEELKTTAVEKLERKNTNILAHNTFKAQNNQTKSYVQKLELQRENSKTTHSNKTL